MLDVEYVPEVEVSEMFIHAKEGNKVPYEESVKFPSKSFRKLFWQEIIFEAQFLSNFFLADYLKIRRGSHKNTIAKSEVLSKI